MKVFVTGATGFIGRRLIKKLLEEDYEVTALVRSSDHHLPVDVKIVLGDILQPQRFCDKGQKYDILFHCAGMVNFNTKNEDELVKIDNQWYFKKRVIYNEGLEGRHKAGQKNPAW